MFPRTLSDYQFIIDNQKETIAAQEKIITTQRNTLTDCQSTITRQADLIKALKEDAMALALNTEEWNEDLGASMCPYCRENDENKEKINHTSTCPITIHAELMKDVEG